MNGIEFQAIIKYWTIRVGVTPAQIRFQKMKNKWASCSSAGRITFNKDLLRKERQFCEYVIVHELIHLHVPNHGSLFKALLSAYIPNSRAFNEMGQICDININRS
jgi:predicted metal-dependent hydrolase